MSDRRYSLIGHSHVIKASDINAESSTDGYVLTSDGAGVAAWEAVAGGSEVNDLSSIVTWANIPDANVPQSAVTQHEAAIDHDALTNFVQNEHLLVGAIDHDQLLNFASNEHFTVASISITGSQVSDFEAVVAAGASTTANTAKVTNATHTGDVTGATGLTIDPTAISGKSLVTAIATDMVLLWDATDSAIKRADVGDFLGGISVSGESKYDMLFKGASAWEHTNSLLIWDPDLAFLQLELAHSVNWLSTADTTVDLLQLAAGGPAAAWPNVDTFSFDQLYDYGVKDCVGCVYDNTGKRLFVIDDDANNSAITTPSNPDGWAVNYVPTDVSAVSTALTSSDQMRSFGWNSDGTAIFMCFFDNDTIEEIANSGTPYAPVSGDLAVTTDTFTVSPIQPRSMDVKPDGTKMWYVSTTTGRNIYEVNLSTADDLTSASMGNSYSPSEGDLIDMKFDPTGTKFYALSLTGRLLWEYTCSTAWDITTASYTGRSLDLSGPEHNGNKSHSFAISPDGTKMSVIFGDTTSASDNEIGYWTAAGGPGDEFQMGNSSYDTAIFGSVVAITSGATSMSGTLFVTGNITTDGLVDGIDIATDVAANTAKSTNVSTTLSLGTITSTTMGITSDGGSDDVVLISADTDDAGLLTAAKWDEIVANNAKVTNANHTGDVAGSTSLTIQALAVHATMLNTDSSADGHVLTSDGAGTVAWEAAAGGGASQLSDLSDVTAASDTNLYVLVSDGSGYEGRLLSSADISDLGTPFEHVSSGYDSADVTVAASAPGSPAQGDVWFDTQAEVLAPDTYLRHISSGYDDASVTVSSSAPSSPSQGDIWFDTT